MNRLDALKELSVKVADGSAPEYSAFTEAYGPSIWGNSFSYAHRSLAWAAYTGSIDAAHALTVSALDGWVVDRATLWGKFSSVSLWGTHEESGERWHHPKDGRVEADAETLARAWLLATIKALIAQEETQ